MSAIARGVPAGNPRLLASAGAIRGGGDGLAGKNPSAPPTLGASNSAAAASPFPKANKKNSAHTLRATMADDPATAKGERKVTSHVLSG
jgi:hypothetical protein